MVKNLVLKNSSVDYAELWCEWLDWAYYKELATISKNIYNTWVLRIIIEDKYWTKLKVWFKDFLYIDPDTNHDSFDKQFLKLKEKELPKGNNLIVFKGTEKVYSILRYAYLTDPQREALWIDTFLEVNTDMKEKFLL